MISLRRHNLVLSIYCNTRGYAFALFEGPLSPYDWGIMEMRGSGKNRRALASITKLFDRYQPDILLLQDTSPSGTRRAQRLLRLNMADAGMGERLGVPI